MRQYNAPSEESCAVSVLPLKSKGSPDSRGLERYAIVLPFPRGKSTTSISAFHILFIFSFFVKTVVVKLYKSRALLKRSILGQYSISFVTYAKLLREEMPPQPALPEEKMGSSSL
ncbi:hypothetical protein BAQU_0725 [Bifidobacterium aquikefiri]|uniref:Uncharacterized protein n=1 Tax=Bifidobacterium aquikefiri TaxID=1653207 RepID=A0A261G8V0_9BIFI|nr:hypothetical protein BAQU_0725 [Bifidobacterium aquikefiri]